MGSDDRQDTISLIDKSQIATGNVFILANSEKENQEIISAFEFPKSAIAFDIGEGKSETVTHFQQRCERKYESLTFVGGRLRVQSEHISFDEADAALFYGKTLCWVTPNPKFVEFRTQATFDRLAGLVGARASWIGVV